MSEPFLGEIKLVAFNFPPKGWAGCNGQVLPIAQNQALFSLLGSDYGGNAQTNFALPDLRGRVPMHKGVLGPNGTKGGNAAETLTVNQLPAHTHSLRAHGALATSASPSAAMLGAKGRLGRDVFGSPAALTQLNPLSMAETGGAQAHPNMQPYLALNFVIALQGIFPSTN